MFKGRSFRFGSKSVNGKRHRLLLGIETRCKWCVLPLEVWCAFLQRFSTLGIGPCAGTRKHKLTQPTPHQPTTGPKSVSFSPCLLDLSSCKQILAWHRWRPKIYAQVSDWCAEPTLTWRSISKIRGQTKEPMSNLAKYVRQAHLVTFWTQRAWSIQQ